MDTPNEIEQQAYMDDMELGMDSTDAGMQADILSATNEGFIVWAKESLGLCLEQGTILFRVAHDLYWANYMSFVEAQSEAVNQ